MEVMVLVGRGGSRGAHVVGVARALCCPFDLVCTAEVAVDFLMVLNWDTSLMCGTGDIDVGLCRGICCVERL